MNDLRNIWQRLQDHEVTPPDEVYFRLLQILKNEKDDEIKVSDAFRGLNEYEVPPPISAQAIIKNITLNSTKHKGSFTSRVKRHRYRLIAASLLLASAILWINKATNFSRNQPLAGKSSNAAVSKLKDTAVLMPGNSAGNVVASHDTVNSSLKTSGIHSRPFEQMRVNGQWISLMDNDILATFTRFEYKNVPAIITAGKDKDIPVHLDRYSNILITKTMSGMLKEMYQVKANGNPTRKARKGREKLEKWKKADESFFDRSKGKNPLDPIDMAEFIFK